MNPGIQTVHHVAFSIIYNGDSKGRVSHVSIACKKNQVDDQEH